MITIDNLQSYIQEQIGLTLEHCNDFVGPHVHKSETYFNLLTRDRFEESQEVFMLERLSQNSSLISRIEPNGLRRVAVFIR